MDTFENWLKNQGKINWRMGGLGIKFIYKGIPCMGILTKQFVNGNALFSSVCIRPIKAGDKISDINGDSVTIDFKNKQKND